MELNKIIQGDCLEVLKDIPDKSIDLVLTDPPYGLNFPYKSYNDTRDNLKDLIYNFIPETRRISDRVYILCGPTQISLYPEPDWIISFTWNTTGTFGKYGYNQWTPILCYGKDIKSFGSINGILKSDVLRISGGGGVGFMRNDEEKKHTCPKPITMISEIIRRLSNEQDTILDPFAGSGTTGVACKNLNRNYILIEKEPEYIKICEERIKNIPNKLLCFT
jgi:site-specific DNA-methyltransferase (adenine-specific)